MYLYYYIYREHIEKAISENFSGKWNSFILTYDFRGGGRLSKALTSRANIDFVIPIRLRRRERQSWQFWTPHGSLVKVPLSTGGGGGGPGSRGRDVSDGPMMVKVYPSLVEPFCNGQTVKQPWRVYQAETPAP